MNIKVPSRSLESTVYFEKMFAFQNKNKMAKEIKSLKGLTDIEAQKRLKDYGLNSFEKKRKGPIFAFVKKFTSPLILLLIIVVLVSIFVGQTTNAYLILPMIFVSVLLDFYNTYKSENALKKLLAKIAITATVFRDGEKKEVEFQYIVPGDTIFLSSGDVIPADCKILESKDLYVNQAVLTGESTPIYKSISTSKKKKSFGAKNLVFMGTSIISGYATALVLKTGFETAFGGIARDISSGEVETHFEKQLKNYSYLIVKVIMIVVFFVFLVNALLHHGWVNSFLFAIAIAISLTPELLPVIITVSLSRGSVEMAKKEVVVRHLSAIQNFGSMNILCTDKTGTITEGKIALVKHLDITGKDSEKVFLYSYLNSFFATGVENPLDKAIKEHEKIDIHQFKKIDEIPFDFSRKRQSVVLTGQEGRFIITKGAPEEVFKICRYYKEGHRNRLLTEKAQKTISKKFETFSRQGYKTLCIAIKEGGDLKEDKMSLMGFILFLDPPKQSAIHTVRELKKLGIEIKIITGDNELLTQRICSKIKLNVKGTLNGEAIRRMDDGQLQKKLLKTTIFARVTPDQKERIIINLKKLNQVVGYLGDGINDAPALKNADVGISVNNAVDVCKQTADIILLHKSLRVLKDGVVEGRKTYRNTVKYILMGLSSDFGNMFSMMGASFLLPFLPMLPTQLIFNDLLYDFSQLSIPTDNVDKEELRRPTNWNFGFIRNYMLIFGLVNAAFDFITYGLLYLVFRVPEHQFQTGWFLESITAQILVVFIIRTKKFPILESRPSALFAVNVIIAVLIAWIVPFTVLGAVFGFTGISPLILSVLAAHVIISLTLVQIIKKWFYRRYQDI